MAKKYQTKKPAAKAPVVAEKEPVAKEIVKAPVAEAKELFPKEIAMAPVPKEIAKEPAVPAKAPAAQKRSSLYRCVTECAVLSAKHNYGRRFIPGMIVDFDKEIRPGIQLRSWVRANCFKAVGDGGDKR